MIMSNSSTIRVQKKIWKQMRQLRYNDYKIIYELKPSINHNRLMEKISPFERELVNILPTIKLYENNEDMFSRIEGKGIYDLETVFPNNYYFYVILKDCCMITTSLLNLDHEISHFVEHTNYKKLLEHNFGLPILFSQEWKNSALVAAIARETRVFAIQSCFDGNSKIINLDDDFLTIPRWINQIKYPYFQFQSSLDVKVWTLDLFERTQKRWCKDRIYEEFKKRAEYIRNWQETKEENVS